MVDKKAQPSFKISDLEHFGKEKIYLIISSLKIILDENKNNVQNILNNLYKEKDIFLCSDIDILLEELIIIKNKLDKKGEIGLIDYVISQIQDIRIQVIGILIKKAINTKKEDNHLKEERKSLLTETKHKTNIYKYLENNIDTESELMTFYLKKSSAIGKSNNLDLLKLLINRFNEFKEDIIWNRINQNRIKKLVDKIKGIDENYKLDENLEKYINKNIHKKSTQLKEKVITEDRKNIIKLLKRSINSSSSITELEGTYNDILESELDQNEEIINLFKLKLEKTISERKRFSDNDTRSIERLVLIVPLNQQIIQNNQHLSNKIKILNTEMKKFNPLKYENDAKNYLDLNYRGVDIKYQSYYKGFEMDIYISKLKLNIEIDGEHHYDGEELRIKDQKRDKSFKKDGIKVERIRLNNIEDIGSELGKIITEKYGLEKQQKKIINKQNKPKIEKRKKNELLENKILTKLGNISNNNKLNMLFIENSNYILRNGSEKLLLTFIKKFKYYKNDIIWDKFKVQMLENIKTSINKTKPDYELPNELLIYIEQNKNLKKRFAKIYKRYIMSLRN